MARAAVLKPAVVAAGIALACLRNGAATRCEGPAGPAGAAPGPTSTLLGPSLPVLKSTVHCCHLPAIYASTFLSSTEHTAARLSAALGVWPPTRVVLLAVPLQRQASPSFVTD